MREAVARTARDHPDRPISVEAADELPVTADRDRIGQVLTNLLDNALRFAPPETAVIVRARPVDDRIEIAVIDRGPGIPLEAQERVFERFTRLEHGAAGTGLGLYISRRLAEAQHGTLEVESATGAGATFTLSLPSAASG